MAKDSQERPKKSPECPKKVSDGEKNRGAQKEEKPKEHACPKEKMKALEDKINTLEGELKNSKALADERLKRLKYLQAEFDNYKKWSDKERAAFAKSAAQKLIKDLLPFLDEFEKAATLVKDEGAKKGIELAGKNLMKTLKSHGLERIEALGKPFDPYLHEAVLKKPSDKEEDEIIEVIQRGWKLNGEVIRHSKVVVSGGL
ncbi:MAG: nucleotide exchange factor GrpE [Candidatus Aenigmatarchaeota archaeon]